MIPANPARLAELLKTLEAMLIESIPKTATKLNPTEPVYVLFLVCFDTTYQREDRVPTLDFLTETWRREAIDKDRSHFGYQVWKNDECTGAVRCEGQDIVRLVSEIYPLMDAEFGSDLPLVDE